MIKYRDLLYGEQVIKEPWVIDIINHPVFLRLKGVSQYGFIEPYHPEATTSRYEHSIGVFLLLKRYGFGVKEQLAGLMHDVSHTTFSHCIDYALDFDSAEKQTFQDDSHEAYIRNSAIADVIRSYGFKIAELVDYKKYPALEMELPDLCADRIDYILRDAMSFDVINLEKVQRIISHLEHDGENWFFSDFLVAQEFSYLFKKMNNDFYAAPWTGFMHYSVGAYVAYALSKNYINRQDLYLMDKEIIEKINFNIKKDKELEKKWKIMNGGKFIIDKNNYDVILKTKSRVVNPFFVYENEKKRFSEIERSWQSIVESEMNPKEYHLRYIR